MYPLGQAVMKLSTAFRSFYSNLKSQEDFTADSGRLQDPNDALLNLLNKLVTSQHFNQTFRDNVESLEKTFTTFSPQIYGEAESPLLLNALKNGFTSLVSELQKAYVSTYSQQKIRWDNIDDTEREKYAKIALTLTPTVYEALTQLKEGLEKHDELWTTYSIYNSSNTANALHKLFFRENGYDSKLPVNVAAGELNHKKGFTGNNILTLLDSDTCELFESSKQPLDDDTLNVDLVEQIKTMFEVPSETDPSQKIVKPMNAHPQQFTHDEIHSALKEVTANAYSLLTGVVGHGDAATFYACEFPTNSLSLKYPSSGAECLDMLLDILRRMFPVLTYLHTQCSLRDKHGGWRDCYYGKDIKSTKWSCKDHVTDKATCQPKCQANTKASCQPTSPLMSYLNDSLHGHLPHDVTSIGCKSSCSTCSKNPPGMPCLPPLGFRAFSNSTHTGRDLCELLEELVGKRGVLTKLYAPLACLLNRPPQWFPDIFSFYCQLTKEWKWMDEAEHKRHPIQNAISGAIERTVACDHNVARELLDSCRHLSKCASHTSHDLNNNPDLTYFVGCQNEYCGKYFTPSIMLRTPHLQPNMRVSICRCYFTLDLKFRHSSNSYLMHTHLFLATTQVAGAASTIMDVELENTALPVVDAIPWLTARQLSPYFISMV
ncbi:hypothetical protein, conserved [Babesia ovata]|uniref:Uncharacterized protein n=1 Tax=Babesia ovata TaxID=189622 RepID=A0A2H6KKE0_9APIC|nr:uncharacterized protein BOVATA_049310 [Babesia ovata]GBE63438.1 hypothetical protein, conserved [Babesia ovata]